MRLQKWSKQFKRLKKNATFFCFNFQVNNFPCQPHAGAWTFPSLSPSWGCLPPLQQQLPSVFQLLLPWHSLISQLFTCGVFFSAGAISLLAMGSVGSSWSDFHAWVWSFSIVFPTSTQLCSTVSCLFPKPLCLQVLSYQARHSAMGPRAWYFIYFDLYN